MNAKKFSDAMSELDSKYIDEALNYKKKAKKPVWIKWGAMAACLCLIVAGAFTLPHFLSLIHIWPSTKPSARSKHSAFKAGSIAARLVFCRSPC